MAMLSLLRLTSLLHIPAGTLTCFIDWGSLWSGSSTSCQVSRRGALGVRHGCATSICWGLRGLAWWNRVLQQLGGSCRQEQLAAAVQEHHSVHLLYNDQPPQDFETQNSSNQGHMKNALFLDEERGFLLLHSIPGFPTCAVDRQPPQDPKVGRPCSACLFPWPVFKDWQTAKLHLPPGVWLQAGRGLHQKITWLGGNSQGLLCSPQTLEQQCITPIKGRGHLPELCQIWKVWRLPIFWLVGRNGSPW